MQTKRSGDPYAVAFSQRPHDLILNRVDERIISDVVRLAVSYPYPHSILGSPDAENYIHKLANQARHEGDGLYALQYSDRVIAAAYLSVYGVGSGSEHTLWKIRHPLIAAGHPSEYLSNLFNMLTAVAVKLRAGTAKFVIFLSELEQEAILQAQAAGFEPEARFKDYYRLGEVCFVYGKTIA